MVSQHFAEKMKTRGKNWKNPNCFWPFQSNQVGLKSFLPRAVCVAVAAAGGDVTQPSATATVSLQCLRLWGPSQLPAFALGAVGRGATALNISPGKLQPVALPVPGATKDTWKVLFLTRVSREERDLTSETRVGLTVLCWKEHQGGWEMSWIKTSKITQVHLCSTSGTTGSFRQVERASLTPYFGQI